MNKYWKYAIFPQFLDEVKDCTYNDMDDIDLTTTLNGMLIKAIQDFKFCKVSLAYENDTAYDPLDNEAYGYYFVDEGIGDAEIRVLLALMKVYWIEGQISFDQNFKNPFFDKDIKGYSPGNLLTAMRGMLQEFKDEARKVKFDYNRINSKGIA